MKNKYAYKSGLFAILVFAAPLSIASQAKAQMDYVQITCSPELEYFSARTISFDLDAELSANLRKYKDATQHIRAEGMHPIFRDLEKHPYICELPRHTLSVEVTNYRPGGEHVACGSLDHFDLLVSIDGKKADEFHAFGSNRCSAPETHMVVLNGGRLSDCTMPYLSNGSEKTACKIKREWSLLDQKNSSAKPAPGEPTKIIEQ